MKVTRLGIRSSKLYRTITPSSSRHPADRGILHPRRSQPKPDEDIRARTPQKPLNDSLPRSTCGGSKIVSSSVVASSQEVGSLFNAGSIVVKHRRRTVLRVFRNPPARAKLL